MKSSNQPEYPYQTNGKGFTVIELLVVIILIVILVTLAGWGIGKIIDSGADAQDLSNLRQIGAGIATFAAENNGRIPNRAVLTPMNLDFMAAVNQSITGNNTSDWRKNPLWYSKRFAKIPPGKSIPSGNYYYAQAWGMNNSLFYESFPNPFQGYLNRAPNLSKLVLVGEKNGAGSEFQASSSGLFPAINPTFEKNVESRYRVSRGSGGTKNKAYYLFADYHIELIAGDQSILAHPEYNSYNPTNRLYYKWW